MNLYLKRSQEFAKDANVVRAQLYKRIDDHGIVGNAIIALFGGKSVHELGRKMDELSRLSRINYRLYQKTKNRRR